MSKFAIDRAIQILGMIDNSEELTQREIAEVVNTSLGTVNQTIQALRNQGLLEAMDITTTRGKRGQQYVITEKGSLSRKLFITERIKQCEEKIKSLESEIRCLSDET